MTSGDKGVAIVIDAGGFNMLGATATLLAAPGSRPNAIGAAIRLTPLAIASDGLTATYTTTGMDFLEGGPWQVQLEVATSVGQVLSSAPSQIYVNPLL